MRADPYLAEMCPLSVCVCPFNGTIEGPPFRLASGVTIYPYTFLCPSAPLWKVPPETAPPEILGSQPSWEATLGHRRAREWGAPGVGAPQ